MPIATLIRDNLTNYRGHARLYHLSEPLDGHEYVIVSAAVVPFSGPETYIFPGNTEGEVTGWSELDGSYRGGLSHEMALAQAGYAVQS